MLDVESAIPFLLNRGLLRSDEIVAGGVGAEPVVRRNRNLRVDRADGSGFFLKQPSQLATRSRETLHHEGAFYVRHSTPAGQLSRLLPRLVLFDKDADLLVLELLGEHESLLTVCLEGLPLRFPVRLWSELGRRLSTVHEAEPFGERGSPPGIVFAGKPSPEWLVTMSPGGFEVLAIIQSSRAILDGLVAVAESWRPVSLVHGDINAGNVLVGATPHDVRFVDWEFCQLGDPAWDIAGFLEIGAGFLLADLCPAVIVQAAMRGFWRSYGGAQDVSRIARFAAARLVHAALQATTSSPTVPKTAVLALQLAENIFADPRRAATEYFALT